jgi:RNase P subunit RPR2
MNVAELSTKLTASLGRNKMDKTMKIKKDTCYFCQFEFENITLTQVETRSDMFYWICENCDEENFVDDDNTKIIKD